MEISDDLLCLFSAQVSKQDDSYVIEVPSHEVDLGAIQQDDIYRVALLSATKAAKTPETPETTETTGESQEPPVEEGDLREVEIEDIGEQGDGLARIEGGYVVIVPDTDVGDHITVRITEARENVAFADVVESRREQAD